MFVAGTARTIDVNETPEEILAIHLGEQRGGVEVLNPGSLLANSSFKLLHKDKEAAN
jgi:hypothetical protein